MKLSKFRLDFSQNNWTEFVLEYIIAKETDNFDISEICDKMAYLVRLPSADMTEQGWRNQRECLTKVFI